MDPQKLFHAGEMGAFESGMYVRKMHLLQHLNHPIPRTLGEVSCSEACNFCLYDMLYLEVWWQGLLVSCIWKFVQ